MNSLCLFAVVWYLAVPLPDEPEQGRTKKSGRVHKLFAEMRAGKNRSHDFPQLQWEDIPDLLELAPSDHVLTSFPVNPLSSQREAQCSEGMMALWFVEGLRKGGTFGSLNSLCLPQNPEKDWTAASEKVHPQVLKAYQDWWKQAQSLSPGKAKEKDPLQGTGLHWH
jgi:Domain of unknown function (DUF4943)